MHHFVLKKTLLVVISMLLLSGFLGCTSSSEADMVTCNQQETTIGNPLSQRQYGNLMGNILHNGIFTKQGDMVISGIDYRLDVIDEETDQKRTISDDVPLFLNLVNGTIYYVNTYPGSWNIYRINVDGADKRKLNDERTESMIVIDDWIYYSVLERVRCMPQTTPECSIYTIYRMKNDGSQKTALYNGRAEDSNFALRGRFFIYNDWIYYTNICDEYKLYKTIIDGSETVKVSDEIFIKEGTSDGIFVNDGWIYYIQANDNYKVYRMRTDGSGRSLVINEPVSSMYVADNEIFFSTVNDDSCVYRITTDGTNKSTILEKSAACIGILGDWIYFQDSYQETKKFKVNRNNPSVYYVLQNSSAG